MKFVSKPALVLALLAWATHPAAAQAQDEDRISLSITPAMATISGDSEFALAGTVDYRFARHLSFEGDITWIDAAANTINRLMQPTTAVFGGGRNRMPNFDTPLGTLVPAITNIGDRLGSASGSTWIGTMGVRYEPATQTARFQPYVAGGFGINYTSRDFTLNAASATLLIDPSVTNAGFAFSGGGGANIQLAGPVWATADAKYFRLSNHRDVIRFGGGVTVKF